MKITVIGCGRLGAPYAAGLAALGHEVLGVDTNTETAALLHAGKPPFAEPGLAEAITDGAATGRLTFTSSYTNAAAHADIHFIAVPTPQAAGSAHHDLGDVFGAAESLAREIWSAAYGASAHHARVVDGAARLARIVAGR